VARYQISAPDGGQYEINAPDDASEADVMAYAQKQFVGAADAGKRSAGATVSSADPERASRASRFAKGARDPFDAGAQILTHALPEGVVDTVNAGVQALNDLPVIGPATKALGITPATKGQIDKNIAEDEIDYQAGRRAAGQSGVDLARAAGSIAATAPLAYAVPGATAASLAARTAAGAVSGAASGALQPVTENQDDFAKEKGKQVAVGTAFGAAAAPVSSAVARVIRPKTSPDVKLLMEEGVTPTTGQILGGWAARLEEKARSIPILGDAITWAQRGAVEDLNRAAYSRALKPIGGTASKDVGREGVEDVYKQLSDAYGRLLPRLSFKADPTFAQELGTLRTMAQQLPEREAQRFEQILRNAVVGKFTPQGNASGETIKMVESDLGRLARGYGKSQEIDQRLLGDALQELQATIRRTLARVNPQHAQELADINQGYSVYAKIRDAAARQGSEKGIFSPAQLAAAVRAGDSSVSKGAYARGAAPMQDLSDAGKAVLGSKYPDSGSAGRLIVGGLTGAAGAGAVGSGLVSPAVPAALGVATLPYLPIIRRLFAHALTKRPEAATAIAERVRQLAPALGATGAPALHEGAGN
jgi:hypothetical protein